MPSSHKQKLDEARDQWTATILACADDDLGTAIGALQDDLVHANQLLGELVAKAREQGWSWERIGAAMGVSRSAAWQRWHGEALAN